MNVALLSRFGWNKLGTLRWGVLKIIVLASKAESVIKRNALLIS